MKLFVGDQSLNTNFKKEQVLFHSDGIVIASDNTPNVNISFENDQQLIIWGSIHAVRRSDGSIMRAISKDFNETLKKLGAQMNAENIIKNVEGHFVGILIKHKKEIIVFGDAFNRKDVFYSHNEKTLFASTTLKWVVDECHFNGYNQEALINIFHVYGNYAPKKHTIYNGINRLGVGQYISYKENIISIEDFSSQRIKTQHYDASKLEEYSDLLHKAIEMRISDNMNWVSLSSGWDSSSLMALLVKICGASKMRAVTARCLYSKKSGVNNQFEVDRAQKIADYFSVPLDIIEVDYTKCEYVEYWEKIRNFLRDNHLYALWDYEHMRLAEHVAANGKSSDHFFNGEISDGAHNLGFAQFASVLDHPDLGFREYSDKMASYLFGPSFFERVLDGTANKDVIYNFYKSRMPELSFDDFSKMNIEERKFKFISSFFISNPRIPFVSKSANSLFTEKGMKSYEQMIFDNYLSDFVECGDPETLYSWILHLYNSFHWQGSTVRSMPTAAEFYSITSSMPFWDTHLQQFLKAMPENWGRGLDLNPTKYPLKWVLKNKLDYPHHLQVGPHSYLYDVDPTWNVYDDVLYGEISEKKDAYFKNLLGSYKYEEILNSSHFNLSYLKRLVDDYLDGKRVTGQERIDLVNLLSISMVGWY